MIKMRNTIFATVALAGLSGGAAADNYEHVSGADVARNAHEAETQCMPMQTDATKNSELCIEAVEAAIRTLAAYHYEVTQNPQDYGYVYEAFGQMNNEIHVKPATVKGGGLQALVDTTYRDIRDHLNLSGEKVEESLMAADNALHHIFVMAGQDSYGLNPNAEDIKHTLIRVAQSVIADRKDDLTPHIQ